MAKYLRIITVPLVLAFCAMILAAGGMAQPSIIDEKVAKRVARDHISDLGYKLAGRSFYSARIAKGQLEQNIWRFPVRYGGSLPTFKGYVIVSALTGELIDSNVESRCKVVTSAHVISVGGC